MNQRADCSGVAVKDRGLDAEDAILALVPHAVAVDEIPVPRAHVAGRQRQAAALLALEQPRGRRFEFGGALGDALLQLGIEPFELPGLAIELGEDPDLGAQHLGNDRHRNIVDRAHLVAAQAVDVGQMDRRDEDHRRLLEARMLADHRRELEAVELRHADVHQDDGDVGLQQLLERFACRTRP